MDTQVEQNTDVGGPVQAFVGWYYTRLWEACITCGLLLKRAGNTLLDAGWGIGDYTALHHYPKTPEGRKVIQALTATADDPEGEYDDGEEPGCLICGGEGMVYGADHLEWDDDGYDDYLECPSCGGSGKAKDMTYC